MILRVLSGPSQGASEGVASREIDEAYAFVLDVDILDLSPGKCTHTPLCTCS